MKAASTKAVYALYSDGESAQRLTDGEVVGIAAEHLLQHGVGAHPGARRDRQFFERQAVLARAASEATEAPR